MDPSDSTSATAPAEDQLDSAQVPEAEEEAEYDPIAAEREERAAAARCPSSLPMIPFLFFSSCGVCCSVTDSIRSRSSSSSSPAVRLLSKKKPVGMFDPLLNNVCLNGVSHLFHHRPSIRPFLPPPPRRWRAGMIISCVSSFPPMQTMKYGLLAGFLTAAHFSRKRKIGFSLASILAHPGICRSLIFLSLNSVHHEQDILLRRCGVGSVSR